MAGGTSTCETSIEKFFSPSCRACQTAIALAGRRGLETDGEEHHLPIGVILRQLDRVQRRVDHAHVAALRLAPLSRSFCEPGTRSISPNEQKITSGRPAMAIALSIISSGVTHTGQPGPWINVISSGSISSIPD